MRLETLSELQMDALREVGNIGAGHAATALSQMIGSPISLSNPTLELVEFSQVPMLVGGAERLVAASYCRLLGDIGGGMLLMAPRESALALIDLLHNREVGSTLSFGRDEEMLLTHVSTILSSAYLAAIARLTDMNLMPAPPSFVLDMAGAILQVATLETGMRAQMALLVRTRFSDERTSVDVMLFFLPNPDDLGVILGRLGIA